jgi:glycosyltransferase involved in cell wall biosynthesis
MKVWIFQTGEPLQIDHENLRPMRAINLSNMLISRGHTVVIWSSDFNHFTKTHRFKGRKIIKYSEYLEIRLIPSFGYSSHFGLRRILDHLQLSFNLKKMLVGLKSPDVAVIGYPPIETAWVFARWLSRNKVPFLVDIIVLWPDIFIRVFPFWIRKYVGFLLSPHRLMMKNTLRSADGISAPTAEFIDYCTLAIKKPGTSNNFVLPLTTPRIIYNQKEISSVNLWLDSKQISQTRHFRISFIGTLNNNFDFNPIIQVAKELKIELVIAGDGPEYKNLYLKCKNLPNIKMLGWIDRVKVEGLINRSDMMLLPYKNLPDFKLNVTNKFYDSVSNYKPVISSQEGVVAQLISSYRIGLKYEIDNVSKLLKELSELIHNKNKFNDLVLNTKNLYEKKYDFNKSYTNFAIHLEKLYENT